MFVLFVLVKQVKRVPPRALQADACVSICAFVLVKQVKRAPDAEVVPCKHVLYEDRVAIDGAGGVHL